METFFDILKPDFLLRNSVYTSVLVGLTCPLVGVFLVLRRMVFLGVALPQISSSGVALALSMHVWMGHYDAAHGAEQQAVAFVGAVVLTFLAIVWLAYMERSGRGMVEGRLGTAFVLATALSILLLAKCPVAERSWLGLFKGEIVAVPNKDLLLAFGSFGLVWLAVWIFRKEFLLVSFDRDLAVTLKKNVFAWDMGLYLVIGITTAIAVLSVGPLITFGFLLIPVLIARLFVHSIAHFMLAASGLGGLTAVIGFYIAYRWDLPVGPTDVALLGVLYCLAVAGQKLWRFKANRRLQGASPVGSVH